MQAMNAAAAATIPVRTSNSQTVPGASSAPSAMSVEMPRKTKTERWESTNPTIRPDPSCSTTLPSIFAAAGQ